MIEDTIIKQAVEKAHLKRVPTMTLSTQENTRTVRSILKEIRENNIDNFLKEVRENNTEWREAINTIERIFNISFKVYTKDIIRIEDQ